VAQVLVRIIYYRINTMCGIAGIITSDIQEIKEPLSRMSEAIAHRGPDSNGMYITDHIGLAHRRLSIVDLSTNANQPMYSL
jgi:asparagine synthase (glutamine-hydrolysing)